MKKTAQRNIKKTWKVQLNKNSEIHSAGLVLPPGDWKEFDPFLIMAEDKVQRGAFDTHPHRGMETVTYIIDGVLEHSDNKGGSGILHPGDAQWMTAGSGIMHLEAPPQNVTAHTLQLWVNLPKANKMAPPRYQDILSSNVPERKEESVVYRVFSGNSGDVVSTTKNITNTELYSFEDVAKVLTELSGKMVTYTDADLEEFTKTLKERNMLEHVIFIFTAFVTDFKNHQYEKVTNDLEKLLGRKPATLKKALKELYKL